jgi:hypothetical protein
MRKPPRPSPTEQPLLIEYEAEPIKEKLTALGGLPLLVETYRALGLASSVKRNVSIKQRDRGFDEATYVESFVILNAAGGECLEDFEPLREDEGLRAMINHPLPSPEAARKFLNAFHEEARIVEAQQSLPLGQVSYIPEESGALQGLGKVNQDLIGELGRRCADQKIATIDLDGTIIESWKKQAQPTYQGGKGYQPILALWAEMDVLVADEFRDGNVPGLQAPLRVAQRAFTALPGTVTEYYFRGDSACHEQQLVRWLRDEKRSSGPAGVIHFAISVRMNPTLKKKIAALPESLWKPYQDSETESTKECADVSNYWPEADELKECGPLRYVAIRIRKRQGELFADGNEVKHYAVVSNQWEWPAKKLLEWHREKAGSIEAAHDVLKNELAAGVMPCSRFGANAAWLRMAVITYNLLSALKRLVLPADLLTARPKRMRFLIFNTAGRIVYHARRMVVKLSRLPDQFLGWWRILRQLPSLGET